MSLKPRPGKSGFRIRTLICKRHSLGKKHASRPQKYGPERPLTLRRCPFPLRHHREAPSPRCPSPRKAGPRRTPQRSPHRLPHKARCPRHLQSRSGPRRHSGTRRTPFNLHHPPTLPIHARQTNPTQPGSVSKRLFPAVVAY